MSHRSSTHCCLLFPLKNKVQCGRSHAGLFNKDGYLAILDHGNGSVAFRNLRIKPLE